MKTNYFLIVFYLTFNLSLSGQTYSGGNGTESTPYLISSTADMTALATAVNAGNSYAGKYFLLTSDLSNITTIIGKPTVGAPSRFFNGIFDGDGHILDVNIIHGSPEAGIFGNIDNAIIKNLGVKGEIKSTNGGNATGGICGQATSSIITNCFNFSNLYGAGGGTSTSVGGICGYSIATIISNCYNAGNIYTAGGGSVIWPNHSKGGGICGAMFSNSKIYTSFSVNSTITGGSNPALGRIVGYLENSSIESSYSLTSMLLNNAVKISENPSSKEGKSESLLSFQTQSWISNNLMYISGTTRMLWDFESMWKMTDNESTYQSLPILKNTKYQKKVTLGTQIGILNQGVGGSAFFMITTENIVNTQHKVILKGAPIGVTCTDVLLSSNKGTLTINTASNTPKGTFPITVIIDNVVSQNFNLIIDSPSSINETEEGKCSIFPNPATEFLIISGFENILNLTIYDLSGKRLTTHENISGNNYKLDLTGLNKGTYFILAKTSTKSKFMKFIKN